MSYIRPVIEAFKNQKAKKISNTESTEKELLLFGNTIAEWRNNKIWITNAGWRTVTTRDRLNMLPNVWVRCRKGNLQINFTNDQSKWQDWDGQWINIEK